ncbi:MAG TPA: hypothetical protein VIC00_05810, partial [Candidatus Acidoferrales bacterium]
KIRENFSIEPSVSAYNLFNFSNFTRETGLLANQTVPYTGNVAGSPGSISGTGTPADRDSLRIGTGSGVFDQAAPRELEFTLKLNF